MQVKLVSTTKPTIDGVETAEELLAFIARVSNPSNQMKAETAPRLIKYLIKNSHWSPFECIHVTFEIVTTRDIARQILRHRSFTFQEFSQRYAEVTEFSEPREARLQDTKNRQNSIELVTDDDEDAALIASEWISSQMYVTQVAEEAYKYALARGIAKEVARAVLPEGLTMSRMYMSGSLRSWIHYCQLREGNGTQKEHREIASEIQRLIFEQFPSVKAALLEIDEQRNSEFENKLLQMVLERGYVLKDEVTLGRPVND